MGALAPPEMTDTQETRVLALLVATGAQKECRDHLSARLKMGLKVKSLKEGQMPSLHPQHHLGLLRTSHTGLCPGEGRGGQGLHPPNMTHACVVTAVLV